MGRLSRIIPSSIAFVAVTSQLIDSVDGGKVVTYRQPYTAKEGEVYRWDCEIFDSVLHIDSAKWGAFDAKCPELVDRIVEIRAKCENKGVCPFVPHRYSGEGQNVKLGNTPCNLTQYVQGIVECRNPCANAKCGEGKCVNATAMQHECKCNAGHVNEGAVKHGKCIVSKCSKNPCGSGKCRLTEGNKNYECIDCAVGTKYMNGTCQKYDTCSEANGGCTNPATCTDGFGKEPTCICPDYMKLTKNNSCKAVNSCKKNNGGCPKGATCSDGLGKPGKCTCPEFSVLQDKKCVAVDQCTINNGNCDPMAKCLNGLGKEPECLCPDYYELVDDKCVDVNECQENNGGCHENATCTNKVGAPHECACKDTYAGDGAVSCLKIGSFLMPDNGTLKLTVAQTKDPLFVELGECLNVSVDPRTSEVVLKNLSMLGSTTEPQNLKLAKKYTEANLIFLFHRSGDTMMVYVNSGEGTEFDPTAAHATVPWNKNCRIDQFSVRGPATLSHDTYMYRTTNIASDITPVLNLHIMAPDGSFRQAKPALPGAVDTHGGDGGNGMTTDEA